ncbi:MAG: TetR family transcriptional regulator [Bryobacteraceae bacterium]|nr:TetR family transcriptional regulator [Bryobacteraceae bacterium]
MIDTKERILDAAERLIADHGIDATSLRTITTQAKVNLAAVNYHFQSKDELVHAVYSRRLRPINEARLAYLDQLEKQHGKQPVPIEKILDAFYDPVMAEIARAPSITRVVGRIYMDPHPSVDRIFTEEIAPVAARFNHALCRTLPHLKRPEVFWRMYLSVGLLAHAMGSARNMMNVSGGLCDGNDAQEMLAQIKAFAKAGFSAPGRQEKS